MPLGRVLFKAEARSVADGHTSCDFILAKQESVENVILSFVFKNFSS